MRRFKYRKKRIPIEFLRNLKKNPIFMLDLSYLANISQCLNLSLFLLIKRKTLSPNKLELTSQHQFSSVAQLCPTLCNPMDCSMTDLPVHHQLLEFTQLMSIELVMPSNQLILCRPLLLLPSIFPSIRIFSNNQFFTLRDQSIGVSASTSVLPINIQDWFPLGWTGWISLQSKGLWRVFSNATVQKHWLFGTQLSVESNSHIHTWLLEKP